MREDGNKPDNSSEEINEEWIFSFKSKWEVEDESEIGVKQAFLLEFYQGS